MCRLMQSPYAIAIFLITRLVLVEGVCSFWKNSLAMHPLVIAPSLTTQLRIAVSWKQIHSTTTQ